MIKGKFEFNVRLPEAIGIVSLVVGIAGLVLGVAGVVLAVISLYR